MVSGADFLRDGGCDPDDADAPIEIPVLEDNWDAVQVFQQCQPVWITGLHAPIYQGISALELQAAMRLEGIQPNAAPDVIAGVRLMERTTRQIHSESRRR